MTQDSMLSGKDFLPLDDDDFCQYIFQLMNKDVAPLGKHASVLKRLDTDQCPVDRLVDAAHRTSDISNELTPYSQTFFAVEDQLIDDSQPKRYCTAANDALQSRLPSNELVSCTSRPFAKANTAKLKSCLKSPTRVEKKRYQRVGIIAPGESIPTASRLRDDEVTGEEVKALPKVTLANVLSPRRVFNTRDEHEHRWRKWVHKIREKCHSKTSYDAWVRRVDEDPSEVSIISSRNHPNSISADGGIMITRKRPLKHLSA